MTRPFVGSCLAPLIVLLAAVPVQGQNPWSHGTTLTVAGGIASASSNTGPQVSTSIGWEITPRIALEGSGTWFDRHDGADAFSAAMTVQQSFMRPHPAAPFVEAGIGLYRASFDASRSTIPGFYRDRLSGAALSGMTMNTFTDPAFVFGAGVNVFASRHIAIRPEVVALLVTRNSQTYVVTTVAVRAAYHFEDHPITPSKRP